MLACALSSVLSDDRLTDVDVDVDVDVADGSQAQGEKNASPICIFVQS